MDALASCCVVLFLVIKFECVFRDRRLFHNRWKSCREEVEGPIYQTIPVLLAAVRCQGWSDGPLLSNGWVS